jgi:hypothetical protein
MHETARGIVTVSEIGYRARRALAAARVGRVAAVFERSLYIDFAGRWVCLAMGAGIGPLTAAVRPTLPWPFRDTIRAGDRVDVTKAGIGLGTRWLFTTARAKTWHPPMPSGWTPDSLARGLRGLEALARNRRPREGLGAFIEGVEIAGTEPREARVAAAAVVDLRDWLMDAFAGGADSDSPPPSAGSLLGLGPGLTPAGDDFLAGVMIAAHSLRRGTVATQLYREIAPQVSRATNPVSGAHLAAAAEGAGSAKLHAVLNPVFAGDLDPLSAGLAGVDTIGHSSGWDALAGIAVTLRAGLAMHENREPWPNRDFV